MFILMSIVFLTFVSTQLGRYRITPKGLDIFQSEWFKSQ